MPVPTTLPALLDFCRDQQLIDDFDQAFDHVTLRIGTECIDLPPWQAEDFLHGLYRRQHILRLLLECEHLA